MKFTLKKVLIVAMLCIVTVIVTGCNTKQKVFEEGQALLAAGQYTAAQEKFIEVSDYEDANSYIRYCSAMQKMNSKEYVSAIAEFQKLNDFLDSNQKMDECTEMWQSMQYDSAIAMISREQYSEASEIFTELEDYKNSGEYLTYCTAHLLAKQEKYAEAIEQLEQLGDFEDSVQQIVAYKVKKIETDYIQAQSLLSLGDYEQAASIFESLQSYQDSNQYCMYAKALFYAENGNYGIARPTLEQLAGFKDANQQLQYYDARYYEEFGDFDHLIEAKEAYSQIELFRDSAARIEAIEQKIEEMYEEAIQLGKEGDFRTAAERLATMRYYKDAYSYATYYEIRYYESQGGIDNLLYAIRNYRSLGKFLDSAERFDTLSDALIDEIVIGDRLFFGCYDSVLWRVLDVDAENRRILMITEDAVQYGVQYGHANWYETWEESNLREWLNDEFFWTLCSDGEDWLVPSVSLAETKLVPNGADSVAIEYTGTVTQDRLFALSIEEARTYLKAGSAASEAYNGYEWWLRDAGLAEYDYGREVYVAAYINYNGDIGYQHHYYYQGDSVRPAMWISLNWHD